MAGGSRPGTTGTLCWGQYRLPYIALHRPGSRVHRGPVPYRGRMATTPRGGGGRGAALTLTSAAVSLMVAGMSRTFNQAAQATV